MKTHLKTGWYFIICSFIFLSCKKEKTFKSYTKPELTINASDPRLAASVIHLVKDTVYILATNLNRYEGQLLKIDAGTLIKVNDGLAITINPGARIEATGTVTQPIIFTSSAYKGTPGFNSFQNTTENSWAGISILGNFPANIDSTSAGTGSMSYVRIEFAGGSIQNNLNQLPSLLLQNVGKGTVVNNIQVSYSVANNSFQISGGNFNAKNLISYACGNSDFVLADGYAGLLQNVLAYRHPYFAPQLGSGNTVAGLVINGSETFPSISNITILGPDFQTGTNPKYYDTTSAGPFGSVNGSRVAAIIVTGGKFHIRNSAFLGFPETGFYLDDYTSVGSLLDSTSDFKYSAVQCPEINRGFYIFPSLFPPYTANDFKGFMLQTSFHNQLFYNFPQLMLSDPFNYDVNPDPFPLAGSPLLNETNFDEPVFDNSFFEKVNYRGALGNNNWLQGWTNFLPLQTSYNN